MGNVSFSSLMLSIFAVGKYNSVQLDTRDSLTFFPNPVRFSSCLLFLCFETSPNSSCDIELWIRQERYLEVYRRKGIGDCSLCSFYFSLSELRGILRKTHNCTPYAKWGVVSLEARLIGIFQSSSHTWSSKNWYRCAWLVYPSGVKPLLTLN